MREGTQMTPPVPIIFSSKDNNSPSSIQQAFTTMNSMTESMTCLSAPATYI